MEDIEKLKDLLINIKSGKYTQMEIFQSFAWGEENVEIFRSLVKEYLPEYYKEGWEEPIQKYLLLKHIREGFPK